MSKFFFIWIFLSLFLRNPLLAIILVVIIFYFLDRRFLGFFPNVTAPFKRMMRINEFKREITINPHYQTKKLQLAQEYLDQKKYQMALPLLEELHGSMDDRGDVLYYLGLAKLRTGDGQNGIELIQEGLRKEPRLLYGEPHIILAEYYLSEEKTEKALEHLNIASQVNSSSVRIFYRLGELYQRSNRKAEAKRSLREGLEIFRSSPPFIRKKERRWANRSRLKLWFGM